MVKIRLSRTGRRNNPSYRIVVINNQAKRDGKNIEILGYYNPTKSLPEIKVDKKRVDYWLSQGAQLSDACQKLLKRDKP